MHVTREQIASRFFLLAQTRMDLHWIIRKDSRQEMDGSPLIKRILKNYSWHNSSTSQERRYIRFLAFFGR